MSIETKISVTFSYDTRAEQAFNRLIFNILKLRMAMFVRANKDVLMQDYARQAIL